MINCFLEQLRTTYCPIQIPSGMNIAGCQMLGFADSSLGNNTKYSQGGHLVLMTPNNEKHVGGKVFLLSSRSGKSKRVASSTMAAELLSSASVVEEIMFLQSWFHEIRHPHLSSLELVHADPKSYLPADVFTDCDDAYQVLTRAAPPCSLTNKSLILHVSMLREAHDNGHVRHWGWCDTHQMIANALTKLEADGTLPSDDLNAMLCTNTFLVKTMYKIDGIQRMPLAVNS